MSVPKGKRGLSKMEFYHNARKLREEITKMLLRDFGVRDKVRKIRTGDNLEVTIIEEYPAWLITGFRDNILGLLRELIANITAGNTIYPVNNEELGLRRHYQNMAIINCEQLIQEIQFCADILPVKLEKFLPHAEKIEFEIQLLKGWRKSGNKLQEKINGAGRREGRGRCGGGTPAEGGSVEPKVRSEGGGFPPFNDTKPALNNKEAKI